jgi:integrase
VLFAPACCFLPCAGASVGRRVSLVASPCVGGAPSFVSAPLGWSGGFRRGSQNGRATSKNKNKELKTMKKPKSIKPEDVEKIASLLNAQDELIFRLSIESGLRISDVLNLRAWYIDKTIYVKEQKTGKHKIITLSDTLLERLKPLKQKAIEKHDKKLHAFKSHRKPSTSVHRSSYHRRLKKVCKQLGIDFSAHSTRKLYAQELLRETGDIFHVQKELNHKYITDTCIYLDLDFKNLLREATKL